jgi:outer membrane PBP1 activator LpoA protein
MMRGRKKLVFILVILIVLLAGVSILKLRHDETIKKSKASASAQADIIANDTKHYDANIKYAKTKAQKNEAILAESSYLLTTKQYDQDQVLLDSVEQKTLDDITLAQYLRARAELAIKKKDFTKAEGYINELLNTNTIISSSVGTKLWQDALTLVKQKKDPFTNTGTPNGR